MTSFGAQLLALPEIFDTRMFEIPDYQRGYAWEKEQVADLLGDIAHLMNDGANVRHYTGTLVLSRPPKSPSNTFHVVDGQQRLTSVVILMCLLAERLPTNEQAAFQHRYVRRGDVGAERSVLSLNSDTRAFFDRVVLGGKHEPEILEAHSRLLGARIQIDAWLRTQEMAGISFLLLRETLETKLGFLVYAPREDAETGIMFEVINNRGKPLSELEKVKNYLIYCTVKLGAPSLRKAIDNDWSGILRNLNLAKKTSAAEEGAFLRYCVAVHLRLNKTDSQYGYVQLKERMALDDALRNGLLRDELVTRIDAFIAFLRAAARWYARLFGQRHEGIDRSLVPVLNLLRAQDAHASIMPLFLAVAIKCEAAPARMKSLLRLIEVLNLRVYIARNVTARNDTGQGELYTHAAAYYHGDLLQGLPMAERATDKWTIDDEDGALEYRLVQFVLGYSPDALFRESFVLKGESTDDLYHWGGLRYFLMNYEQHLQPNKTISIDKIALRRADGKSADFLSVEHLWAVNNRAAPGQNDRSIDNFERRRLGNFVLLELRLNIQGGHQGIEQKVARYLGHETGEPPTDLEQVRRAAADTQSALKRMPSGYRGKSYYLGLHKGINDAQERRYIEYAEQRWSVRDRACHEALSKPN